MYGLPDDFALPSFSSACLLQVAIGQHQVQLSFDGKNRSVSIESRYAVIDPGCGREEFTSMPAGAAKLAALLGARLQDVSGTRDATLMLNFDTGPTSSSSTTALTTRVTRYTTAIGSSSSDHAGRPIGRATSRRLLRTMNKRAVMPPVVRRGAHAAAGIERDGHGRVSRALSRRYSPYRLAAWSRASISGSVRAR